MITAKEAMMQTQEIKNAKILEQNNKTIQFLEEAIFNNIKEGIFSVCSYTSYLNQNQCETIQKYFENLHYKVSHSHPAGRSRVLWYISWED